MMLTLFILASVSAPDRVVVYPDRAQVTRTTHLVCGNRVAVTFDRVPPVASGDSFRASLEGGTIDGLRAELITLPNEFSKQAEQLAARLEEIDQERGALDDRAALSRSQGQVSGRYYELALQAIATEMTGEKPDLKAWQNALDSSLTSSRGVLTAQAEVAAKVRTLQRLRVRLSAELTDLRRAADKHAWVVEVLTSCPAGQTADLELSYLVSGASWTPAYEARADEQHGLVELTTWATITQRTGEAWNQVALSLSTAVPSQNATVPELKKLLVLGEERPPEKKVLVRREEAVEHATSSIAEQALATEALHTTDQGLSVQLRLPDPASVNGEATPVRLLVGKTSLNATFEVAAFPRVQQVAFRVAQLVNQAPWPLLAGQVDAFRATGLVGRFPLERVAKGAPFTLTFGIDDSVRVKRFTLEEFKRDTGLFGARHRFTYAYRFELANYGQTSLEVALSDQLPVSELDDLIVTVGAKTTPGYRLEPADGLAKWAVSLKPGEKKNVEFSFQVDVPKSYELGF